MASVLALISKAVFEKQAPGAKLGATLGMDRYVSAGKGLAPLADGGALFLVTVRPPERLWLCAILDAPEFDGTMWRSATASAAPIVDVTELLPSVKLANGKGIQAPEGKLGMSLQTPRTLSDEDDALLRAAAGGAAKPSIKKAAAGGAPAAPSPPRPTPPPKAKPPAAAAATGDLFAQIVADPDDVALRRVYADQLTEVGDPHGEYIQLACAADALPDGDPKRAELEELALRLRRRHSLAFSRALRRVPYFNRSHEGSRPFELERGLPERFVASTTKALLDALPDGAKAAPLRALTLHRATNADLARLATMPELARVRALRIENSHELGPEGLVALLRSPHLQRLETLAVTATLSSAVLAAMADAPALDGLTALGLHGDARGDAKATDLDALLRSPRLASLRELDLSSIDVDPATLGGLALLEDLALTDLSIGGAKGAAQLAAAPNLTQLRRLCLRDLDIGDKGLATLVGSPRLGALRTLDLAAMVSGKKVAAVLDAMALPSLERLRLRGSPLREEGAKAIVAAQKKLARLTLLDVSGGQLKDDGAKALAALELRHLASVDFDGNGIGPDGMEALADGPLLARARTLSVQNNKCGTEGGVALARGKFVANLRSLHLYYNWMGVKGVRALLEAASQLEVLSAGANNYGPEPARAIAASKTLRRLREVTFGEGGIDVAALAKSPAAQTFESLSLSNSAIDLAAAEALAALPTLEELHLVFSRPDDDAARLLRARFGPNLTTWGDFDRINALPGPE